LFAQSLAFVQVTQQRLGQEPLRGPIAGPLELVMASGHVLDQVLHPEQRVTPISHRRVLLHSPELTGWKPVFLSDRSIRFLEAPKT
jgi:hypothetical protein